MGWLGGGRDDARLGIYTNIVFMVSEIELIKRKGIQFFAI